METFAIQFFLCLSLSSMGSAWLSPSLEGRSTGLGNQCGGNLVASEGFILYYKNTTNIRCVWFIQAPNATTYNVETYFPQTVPVNNLILTTFNYGDSESHYYPIKNENLTLHNVVVLMVTFYTGSTTDYSGGFGLRFTTSYGKGNPAPLLWPHHMLQNGTSINYPIDFGRSKYSKLELTCFLFAPKDGIFSPKKETSVCYSESLVYGCKDHVTIYQFDYYSKWQRATSICGWATQKFQNKDLTLAVFESDREYEGSGFKLSYNKKC